MCGRYKLNTPGDELWESFYMWDKVRVKGEIVDAATILTTTPRGVATEVHDRMPVILPVGANGVARPHVTLRRFA